MFSGITQSAHATGLTQAHLDKKESLGRWCSSRLVLLSSGLVTCWRAAACLCHSWGKRWYSRVSTLLWSSWGIYNHLLRSSSLPLHVYAPVQVCEWDGSHLANPPLHMLHILVTLLSSLQRILFSVPQPVTLTQAAIPWRQRSYLKRNGTRTKTSTVYSLQSSLVWGVYYPPDSDGRYTKEEKESRRYWSRKRCSEAREHWEVLRMDRIKSLNSAQQRSPTG